MLWNNGHEVRVTSAIPGRTDGNPRKVTSPARQTPPSGWLGQVKMLGGVSLPQNLQRGVPLPQNAILIGAEDSECVREQVAAFTPAPSTGFRLHHRQRRWVHLHRPRVAERLPANRFASMFRNADESRPALYRVPLLFRPAR
jgi:hypothetical protein